MKVQLAEAEKVAPGSATKTGTAAETPVKKDFPPFDPTTFASQLLWFAITFVAFYLVVAKVVVPRIGGILTERRGRIEGDLGDAEKAKQEAEAAGIAYEKALGEARARGFDIAEEAAERAKAAAAAERATTEAGLAKKLAEAEARIAEIKTRALGEVGAIAAETAEAVVRALADASPTPAEIEEAVGAVMSGRSGG